MTRETLAKLRKIELLAEENIAKETGATVEVTIRDHFVIYTEDISLVETIKEFFSQVKDLVDETSYEASEDGPAAMVLKFEMAS